MNITTARRAPASFPTGVKGMLPEGYTPGPYDVQIGRGRCIKESTGNLWFEELVQSVSAEYSAAVKKARKSEILMEKVVKVVLTMGRFIKKDSNSGRYYEVEDAMGRNTSAQAMRDCLSGTYRSSRQAKRKRRKTERKQDNPAKGARNFSLNIIDAATLNANGRGIGSLEYWQAKLPSSTPTSDSYLDCFDILAEAFGDNSFDDACQSNPFEPVPLTMSDHVVLRPIPEAVYSSGNMWFGDDDIQYYSGPW